MRFVNAYRRPPKMVGNTLLMIYYQTGSIFDSGAQALVNCKGVMGAGLALGCGRGGLRWSAVEPLILAAFANLPYPTVYLYPPT